MSAPTARAPADGIYPSLYLHSYSTTSLSLPSYFKNPPPSLHLHLLPLLSIPFCYLYPFTLYPHYLSLSLYPSTSPHSSYLSAFLPSFLSTSVLYFLTPPLFLFTLIYPSPFTPLYPLHLHSSISLHPSTSLPLSLFLPLATLLFVPSISLFFPLTALSNLAPRFIVP